ncbi:SpoIIE family protein phosphatase [Streptosporangium sp. NBC_01756]|uniref:SpoIIE family protein phosphatase n=1 Tax=Streptosporangium sp. NBC_01756 TaxID=2975950 RepID=UPI002DDAA70B|nr:SpoIIE family protein phosphatase [Streptosporangium sp. NBC_01756]WSC87941.1 SpoIIE family protein phosphatase [Streptosporangium sp. NBC_01756]
MITPQSPEDERTGRVEDVEAMILARLARLRGRMRREAAIDEMTCRLAVRMNVRPDEAAAHLARLSHDSGVDLLEVARSVDERHLAMPRNPPVEVPPWLHGILAAAHLPAAYLTPVTDGTGRIVDFLIATTSDHAYDMTGRPADLLRGRRLVECSPGVVRSGLLDAYLRVYETGEPFSRGPFGYVEIRDERLWPASVSVKAVRAAEGVLVTWRAHDDEERLINGWERAQRVVGLGWSEWNLATGRVFWTSEMYEMFGWDSAEGPMPLDRLPRMVPPEDVPLVEEMMFTLLEYREAVEQEIRIQHRHGIRHLRLVAEPVLDQEGVPTAVRIMAQDVTAARRRERALALAHEQASRARSRAEEEHRVVVTLQDTIVPLRKGVIDLPGLLVGLRYFPGEEVEGLGGDWFKARPLPDGRVLLAIGDAMGHGLTAASLMVQMRSGLAGLAYTGAEADQLASWLNELIYHANQGITATGTAIIGHFDPSSRILNWISAGHLPPILVRDGASFLKGSAGTMLGAFEAMKYTVNTTQLAEGDLLLLYTDGIVERRGRDLDEGLNALLDAAGRCVEGDLEKDIASIIRQVGGEQSDDDICLLAFRVL